ncbi:hypothetical protein PAPHI01_1431 [Pancytospora philotis]|nr:hypothetical protein PAPHI01_1431 [Pancytospora philotis]
MARFFQNLDDESADTKSKATKMAGKKHGGAEKGSRVDGLDSRAEEALAAGKSFDKLAKKLITDMKKFVKDFEDGRLTSTLVDFFSDQRFAGHGQLRRMALELLERFPEDRRMIFGDIAAGSGEDDESAEEASEEAQQLAAPKRIVRDDLDTLLAIADDSEKEKALRAYWDGDVSESERAAVALALFAVYARRRSGEQMLAVLEEARVCLCGSTHHAQIFAKGVDTYLGRLYECLDEGLYARYEALLEQLQRINPAAVENRLLEFRCFKLSLNIETENPQFKFLHAIRNGDWAAARAMHSLGATSRTYLRILLEFADLAILNGGWRVAYDTLIFCHKHDVPGLSTRLTGLCIVLNAALIGEPFFADFIASFKNFDTNALALPSAHEDEELYRAFYLLNMLDYAEAAKIVQTVCGFDCQSALKESAAQMARSQ